MKKKSLIELFIYVTIVVVAIVLLFTYKPKEKEVKIPSEFKIERSENNAAISN